MPIGCRKVTVSKDQVIPFDNEVVVIAPSRARTDESADKLRRIVRLVRGWNRIEKQLVVGNRSDSGISDAVRRNIALDDLHRRFSVAFINSEDKRFVLFDRAAE